MAIRINNAKNFKGKAYVAADELDNLIKSMTFANTGSAIPMATGNSANDWVINFTNIDGTPATTSAVDLTSIKNYIDNKSITVTGGNGIAIDSSNSLNPKIVADIDSSTIVFVGDTDDSKKLATNLSIKKLGTTTTGFAASYALFAGDKQLGDTNNVINIVKDKFLKSVELGYGTFIDASTAPTGWTTEKDDTKHAILKLTFNTNTDADATDAEGETVTYIDVNDMFHDKTAGNYIDSTALNSNVIKVNVGNGIDATNSASITVKKDSASEQVYIAKGNQVDVFSISSDGLKIANVQSAINNAINAEHATASAAIETLEAQVSAFEGNTSAAVNALNTRIVDVAGNAATAIGNVSAAVSAVDS